MELEGSLLCQQEPRYWALSSARSIQSIPPHPIILRSILLLFSHLRVCLSSGLFPSGFATNILYAFLSHAFYRVHVHPHPLLLDHCIVFGKENKS
jgi:hypothetical protein